MCDNCGVCGVPRHVWNGAQMVNCPHTVRDPIMASDTRQTRPSQDTRRAIHTPPTQPHSVVSDNLGRMAQGERGGVSQRIARADTRPQLFQLIAIVIQPVLYLRGPRLPSQLSTRAPRRLPPAHPARTTSRPTGELVRFQTHPVPCESELSKLCLRSRLLHGNSLAPLPPSLV
jgi:hypothetical protein